LTRARGTRFRERIQLTDTSIQRIRARIRSMRARVGDRRWRMPPIRRAIEPIREAIPPTSGRVEASRWQVRLILLASRQMARESAALRDALATRSLALAQETTARARASAALVGGRRLRPSRHARDAASAAVTPADLDRLAVRPSDDVLGDRCGTQSFDQRQREPRRLREPKVTTAAACAALESQAPVSGRRPVATDTACFACEEFWQ
jgi:hypothetical protein